jgi:hypothetical protein
MLAPPPPPPPCVPATATVVAVRGSAAVYAQSGGRYGCYAGGAPVTLLAPTPERDTLRRITLNGRFVAFERTANGVDTSRSKVDVFDLRGQRRVERHNAIRHVGAPEFVEAVGALRLRHDGAVAWIASGHSLGVASARMRGGPPPPHPPFTREVHGARRGHDHVFSRSETVVVGSLGLRGRFVLWREGRVQKRARL